MADWFDTRFREVADPGAPDPAFAARMRRLVVDEWRAETASPDRRDDAGVDETPTGTGETIVLDTEERVTNPPGSQQTSRAKKRWLLVAAAVAVVGLAGALLVDSDDEEVDTAGTTPGPAAAVQPAREVPQDDEFLPLEQGRWFVDADGDPATPLRVSFDIAAEGWESWLGTVDFSGRSHVALTTTVITNLTGHACTDHAPADPPVGPSVDDLATALTSLEPFEVTAPPTGVEVLGHRGTHLQLTVPDLPTVSGRGNEGFAGCTGDNLAAWFSPLHDGGASPYFGYNGEPGRTEDFWILDVDGTRLVLITTSGPGSQPEDVAELDAIFESIRIER